MTHDAYLMVLMIVAAAVAVWQRTKIVGVIRKVQQDFRAFDELTKK